MSSVIQIG